MNAITNSQMTARTNSKLFPPITNVIHTGKEEILEKKYTNKKLQTKMFS